MHEWNEKTRNLTVRIEHPYSRRRLHATGTEVATSWTSVSEIHEGDPTSARIEAHRSQWHYRPGWDTQVDTVLRFSTTKDAFMFECEVSCREGDQRFFSRKWRRLIPRKWI